MVYNKTMKRSLQKSRNFEIRQFILEQVLNKTPHLTDLVRRHYKVSRQGAFKHIAALLKEGFLRASGRTTNRTYELGPRRFLHKSYAIKKGLGEDEIWAKDFSPLFQGLKANVLNICEYGFTEIVNNALDHSDGSKLHITAEVSPGDIHILIEDNGVGVFHKIQEEMGLPDPRLSLLELSKGKYTTDPDRHTGEGVFFTSKLCDAFVMRAGGLTFSHFSSAKFDSLVWADSEKIGTHVHLRINPATPRTTKGVFDQFTDRHIGFNKTIVPVKLAQFEGGNLISRSQGKRLVSRFEDFRHVILDFEDVDSIGRAFADEVFRVFARKYPKTKMVNVNTNKEIDQAIRAVWKSV